MQQDMLVFEIARINSRRRPLPVKFSKAPRQVAHSQLVLRWGLTPEHVVKGLRETILSVTLL